MKHELQKFRSRWQRWLGQKTRCDKPYWTTLISCNWTGWVYKTLEAHSLKTPSRIDSRHGVKNWYSFTISIATIAELRQLDNLYYIEKMK